MRLRVLLAIASSVFFSVSALAVPLTPTSYTFERPTDCGTWCYHDPNFTKLTDGVVGNAGWAVNQGAEWDGWVNGGIVDITFFFSAPVKLNSVSIGTTQDNLWDVVIPTFDVTAYNNGAFTFFDGIDNYPGTPVNDKDPYDMGAHPFYTIYTQNVYANEVHVTALAQGPWIFIDEVRFDGEPGRANVPEPSVFALLMLGLLAIGARRFKRSV